MTGQPEIDPALVRAAQRGDRIAVADLRDALARYVGRVCGPIALQDGPDAAQEARIAIFRHLGGLREPGAIYRWARAVAGREADRAAPKAVRAVPAGRAGEGGRGQAVGGWSRVPGGTVSSRLVRGRRSFRKGWLP